MNLSTIGGCHILGRSALMPALRACCRHAAAVSWPGWALHQMGCHSLLMSCAEKVEGAVPGRMARAPARSAATPQC